MVDDQEHTDVIARKPPVHTAVIDPRGTRNNDLLDLLCDQTSGRPEVVDTPDGRRAGLDEHRHHVLVQEAIPEDAEHVPDYSHHRYGEALGILRDNVHQTAHALAFGSAAPQLLAHPVAIIAILVSRRLLRGFQGFRQLRHG